jgi:hypothetical protein
MDNNFGYIMDRTYDLINTKYIAWPIELEAEQQKTLINKMIEYYSNTEDFEKCIELKNKLNSIDTIINEF